MLGGRWDSAALGRVNPYVPLLVIAAGLILFLSISRPVGTGLVIGAILAFINSLFLSGRVEVAANTGDVARALLVMQIGMFAALGVIAATTIVLVHFSIAMAVAAAAGFAIAQLAMLAVFYWTRGRHDLAGERQTT